MIDKGTVVVGMSGGVDSSAAAYLLKKEGYRVIGVTMQIWQDEDPDKVSEEGGCCGLSAVDDARAVCQKLDIPYYVMNFKQEFKCNVIDNFVDEYIAGRTPNPCIRCNRYVKWEGLLNRSIEIGADYIATGHYARIIKLPNGRYSIAESVTDKKDQTYALYNLTQEQLKRTLMPVGDYTKDEIRKIAENAGLNVAHKKDSQDICFISDDDYAGFVDRTGRVIPPEGNFVDKNGNILGRHKGITHYTIGQRRGLGLAMGHYVYVAGINVDKNEVIIGENEDIFTDRLVCSSINLMSIEKLTEEREVKCKIRYGHKGESAIIRQLDDDRIEVLFKEKVRAVTPGQAAVFYEDGHVLGGGIIV